MKTYALILMVLFATFGCLGGPGYPERISIPSRTILPTEAPPTQPPTETPFPTVPAELPPPPPESTPVQTTLPPPPPQPPQTPSPTETPPEPVEQPFTLLWEYDTGVDVYGVGITEDGEMILAGSSDFNLYAFDKTGEVLWQYELFGAVNDISLTPNADRIVATSFVTPNGTVYLFDSKGRLIWKKTLEAPAWGADISSDGETIALSLGNDKIRILDKNGNTEWEYETRHSAWGVWEIGLKPDGGVVAGSDDTYFYVLSPDGQLIFENSQGGTGHTTGVAVSKEGDYVGIVTGRSMSVYFYQGTNLLWETQTGFNNGDIDMTPDGELVAVASYDKNAYLFNKKGELVMKVPMKERVQSVVLSSDGKYLVAGTWNGGIYLFEVKP